MADFPDSTLLSKLHQALSRRSLMREMAAAGMLAAVPVAAPVPVPSPRVRMNALIEELFVVSVNDEPIDLLDLCDELGRISSYFECAFLAVPEGCTDIESTNAIQSVMLLAQDRLEAVKSRVDCERRRQWLVEERDGKKKAA
jgi:hypothetical protein